MPSVAEMRATPSGKRPERTMTVCTRPDLQAEIESLTNRLVALGVERASLEEKLGGSPVDDDGNPIGPPPRLGSGMTATERAKIKKSVAKIQADEQGLQVKLNDLLTEQTQSDGELRLRAIPDGEWRLWVDKFPTRDEESEPGKRDLRVSGGFCNSDALTEDLAPFLASWNGEALESSDWAAWLSEAMSGPEKVTAAQLVVSMQEVGTDFRQWRAALSTNLARFAASA